MHIRTRMLADEATYYANDICDKDADADWYEVRDDKFAELILRQCISTIYGSETPNKNQKWLVKELLYKFGYGVGE